MSRNSRYTDKYNQTVIDLLRPGNLELLGTGISGFLSTDL